MGIKAIIASIVSIGALGGGVAGGVYFSGPKASKSSEERKTNDGSQVVTGAQDTSSENANGNNQGTQQSENRLPTNPVDSSGVSAQPSDGSSQPERS